MAERKVDTLRDIARRFQAGEISLRQAALEAGMSEEQFERVVRSYTWVENKAGQAAHAASTAANAGRRLWKRWTGNG